jgi:hypothetical protein
MVRNIEKLLKRCILNYQLVVFSPLMFVKNKNRQVDIFLLKSI